MKRLSPKLIVAIVGFVLVVLAIPATIYALNSNKEKVPAPEEKYYPIDTSAEYVPDQVLVKFAQGYEPDVVYGLVTEREVLQETVLGKAVIARQNAEYALTGQKTPEERKLVLDQLFGELGVISYSRVTQDDDPVMSRYYILEFPEGSDISLLQEELSLSEATTGIEPDYIGGLFEAVVPNDPRYQSMWGLKMIEAEVGWEKTTGSDSVIVGVTDTGIDSSHEDLKDHIAPGGKNIVDNNNDSQDTHHHGTHVAGTIGAVTNNGIGVAGINWNVKLLPVKVCNAQGKCPTSAVASGISYASSNGAKVINLSVGGPPGCTQQSIYQDAVNQATSRGTLVVVAAGNSNADASGFSPASCNNTLTVGAVGPTKSRAYYSNYGSKVHVSAPGGSGTTTENGILSTVPGNLYGVLAGTSMATPHVAGVAALLLAQDPGLTPEEIKSCIIKGATQISTDKPIGPLLNIPGALEACGITQNASPPPSTTPSTTLTPSPSDTLPSGTITPSPSPTGGATGSYSVSGVVYFDTNRNQQKDPSESAVTTATLSLAGPTSKTTSTSDTGNFQLSGLTPGKYTLTQAYQGQDIWEYNFELSDSNNSYYFEIPVFTSASASPSPTRAATSTITPSRAPTSTSGKRPTPTPTPLKYYRCKTVQVTPTPSTRTFIGIGKRIGISYLKCEPLNENNR